MSYRLLRHCQWRFSLHCMRCGNLRASDRSERMQRVPRQHLVQQQRQPAVRQQRGVLQFRLQPHGVLPLQLGLHDDGCIKQVGPADDSVHLASRGLRDPLARAWRQLVLILCLCYTGQRRVRQRDLDFPAFCYAQRHLNVFPVDLPLVHADPCRNEQSFYLRVHLRFYFTHLRPKLVDCAAQCPDHVAAV